MNPELTIIVPAYNEASVIDKNVDEIIGVLKKYGKSFELILVNDGSRDLTGKVMESVAKKYSEVRVFHHKFNRGRGAGLRTGFDNAKGKYVISLDADLSYTPEHIIRIAEHLKKSGADIVQGSPYMKGGKAANVPGFRLALSKWGNRILTKSVGKNLTVVTCILRGYKKEVLDSLFLTSERKEIHLEIISKALDLGYRVEEVPATLRWRQKPTKKTVRKSKFQLGRLVSNHLAFTFTETPFLLLGSIGILLSLIGLGLGVEITQLWLTGTLDPTRPIVTLMVILLLAGIQVLLFAFLASQNRHNRRELVLIQSQLKKLEKK